MYCSLYDVTMIQRYVAQPDVFVASRRSDITLIFLSCIQVEGLWNIINGLVFGLLEDIVVLTVIIILILDLFTQTIVSYTII